MLPEWEPPADLSRVVTLQTTTRRDHMARERQRQRNEIAERMAARGTLNSGGFNATVNNSALTLFREFGSGLLADYLGDAEDLRWNADAASWLHAQYNQYIDATANRLAESLIGDNRQRNAEAALQAASALKRDAEIAFTRARMRREQPVQRPVALSPEQQRDFFISHAGEDREDVARPLAEHLERRGHSIWFSGYELTLGDSLLQKISRGLAESRFGIVILSDAFFAKPWPQTELEGLAARAINERRKVILPVWHNISQGEIVRYSPPLADRLGVETTRGLDIVADEIVRAFQAERNA